jgi:hypothetical protein
MFVNLKNSNFERKTDKENYRENFFVFTLPWKWQAGLNPSQLACLLPHHLEGIPDFRMDLCHGKKMPTGTSADLVSSRGLVI